MTELGKLIDAASRANHGRSMQAAADLATKRGVPISKSAISSAASQIKSVTPLLVRGIAAGYDLPEEDVARAACADLGFAIADYKLSPESAIRRDPDLSAQARAILLAAIEAARHPSSRIITDESQDSSWPPIHWEAPRQEPRMVRDEDGEQRHQGRGR